MDAYIVKIKKKRNNKREVVRCEKTEKSHVGIRELVICLQITVNAVFLSWISLKKSAVNCQGLVRLSNDSASRAMYKERENKL